MAKKLYPEESVQAIADAIRTKTGKSDKMTVGEMSGEIEGIEKGWSVDEIAERSISDNISGATTYVKSDSFRGCKKITGISFPNATTLGGYSFSSCVKLTQTDIPAVSFLGEYCFYNCTSLKMIDCPNLMNLGSNCLRLSALATLIMRLGAVATLVNVNAFISTPIASGTGYIYVPSALVDSYKTATNWTTYAAQFRALEDYTVDGTIDGELDESKI